jgi:hypothetical protein
MRPARASTHGRCPRCSADYARVGSPLCVPFVRFPYAFDSQSRAVPRGLENTRRRAAAAASCSAVHARSRSLGRRRTQLPSACPGHLHGLARPAIEALRALFRSAVGNLEPLCGRREYSGSLIDYSPYNHRTEIGHRQAASLTDRGPGWLGAINSIPRLEVPTAKRSPLTLADTPC